MFSLKGDTARAFLDDVAPMASFEDLAPFTLVSGERLLAVGWLDPKRPFPTAPPDAELVQALRNRLAGWQPPGAPRGRHRCPFCPAGEPAASGSRLLLVPGDGVAFVAPELISHYVRKHHYAPPAAFVDAVRAPPPRWDDPWQAAHFPDLRQELESRRGLVQVLEGIEPVRLRPGMYFGGTGSQGLEAMLFEVLGNAVDQSLAGHAQRIDVEVGPDGWVTVEDDGRGIALDATYGGVPALEAIFARLHAGPTLDEHHPHVHVRAGLMGVGVASVNAVSQRFEIETRRDGVAWRAAFEGGHLVEPLVRVGETTKRGTRIRYRVDDEIFDTVHLDLPAIEARLAALARLLGTLELRFRGASLQRPGGLAAWLRELVPDALPQTMLSGTGIHADVGVDFALAWKPGAKTPWVRSFVNYSETLDGGSHVQGLRQAIARTGPSRPLRLLVSRGLVGLVHVTLLHPRFQGPTRARLHVKEAQTAVGRVVREALTKNPTFWDWLLENVSS